jgi:hypothetical protein
MAAAVVRRAAVRFFDRVTPQAGETANDAIAAYRSAFKAELDRDGLMCLFGILGAETGGLAPEIANETLSFFQRCIEDLSRRVGGPELDRRLSRRGSRLRRSGLHLDLKSTKARASALEGEAVVSALMTSILDVLSGCEGHHSSRRLQLEAEAARTAH